MKFIKKWEKCRDAVGGETYIKYRKERYLPRASGMDDADYNAYIMRAQFFNATGRTLDGLSGMINRKPIITQIPDGFEKYLENVDGKGHSLNQFCSETVKDFLTTAWGGVLVDMPKMENVRSQKDFEDANLSAYMTYYKAESIINWHWASDGRKQYLDFVIFREKTEVVKADFTLEQRNNYRVCKIDENGYYVQILYNDRDVVIDKVEPKIKGKRFNYIPFYFLSTSDYPQEPILEDLINVNLSHYRKSADYENGLHWTGVPTPWTQGADVPTVLVNGVEVASEPLKLGGSVVQNLPAGASMQYLEFSGSGCNQLANAMNADEERMAILGARIISQERKGVESAETARIHRAGENSILADIANNFSIVFTKLLKIYLEWSSSKEVPEDKHQVIFNTDYDVSALSASDLAQYVAAWQQGAISKKTMFRNLQEGEIIASDKTFEEEQAEIDEEQKSRIPIPNEDE
ncbi:protein of unknown function [Treponema bryantii]|uniref:DUF4055 domain-containing protein n=1 Tax=Treponema bryantii TaxID=163 RepID=A0A1H9AVN6_9SPIR|nr:DUF4055 domain-containing protein [Treponema bryantii]SEP80547.1 protein of unknown function [Treponema bryantii]